MGEFYSSFLFALILIFLLSSTIISDVSVCVYLLLLSFQLGKSTFIGGHLLTQYWNELLGKKLTFVEHCLIQLSFSPVRESL